MRKFSPAFTVTYGVFAIAALVYLYPLFAGVAVAVVVILAVVLVLAVAKEDGRKERELQSQGYHVELVLPGVLRDGLDDIAVVYYNARGQIWLPGKIEKGKYVLLFNAPLGWDSKAPRWAWDEKSTVLERIAKAYPKMIIQ
jgi:hypothetical protein